MLSCDSECSESKEESGLKYFWLWSERVRKQNKTHDRKKEKSKKAQRELGKTKERKKRK